MAKILRDLGGGRLLVQTNKAGALGDCSVCHRDEAGPYVVGNNEPAFCGSCARGAGELQ